MFAAARPSSLLKAKIPIALAGTLPFSACIYRRAGPCNCLYTYIYIYISTESNEFIIFTWNELVSFFRGCQSDGTSTIGGNQPSPTWSHRTPSSSTKASSKFVHPSAEFQYKIKANSPQLRTVYLICHLLCVYESDKQECDGWPPNYGSSAGSYFVGFPIPALEMRTSPADQNALALSCQE